MSSSLPAALPAPRVARTHRIVLLALFAIYLGLLVWVVLWKAHDPFIGRDDMRGIKLVPFLAAGRFGASDPVEVAANVLGFVPLGGYLRLLWRLTSGRAIVAGLLVSAALEAGQYVFATGSTDTSDLIANTAGALAGWALIEAARRMLGARMTTVAVRLCAVATIIALVGIGLAVASFPRLPPRGGDPGTGGVMR